MTARGPQLQPPSFDRRQFLRGIGLSTLAVGIGGTLLTSCSSGNTVGSPVTITAKDVAGASGKVKILVWQGYDDPSAFSGLNNLTIAPAYLAQNEDTITKTKAAGSFDALTIFQGQIDPLISTKRIVPIDTALLTNYSQLLPFFRESDALRRGGDVFGVPYVWGTMMVAYAADRVDKPVVFDDLMTAKLKGKIAMPDDAYAGITTFARYAGFENPNNLTSAQLDKVMALLERFKPQLLTIANNYGELPAMYGRGEILVSVPDWTPTVLGASGVNVRTTILEEGAFSFVDSWMVVHDGDNLAGAYALIDEAIGSTAQKAISSVVGLGIVNEAAISALDPTVANAWNYDKLADNFTKAPLYRGVPIEADGDVAPFQEWVDRWSKFKSS